MILNQIKNIPHHISYHFNKEKYKNIKKPYFILLKTLENDKRIAATGSLKPLEDIANSFMTQNQPVAAAYCEIASFLQHSGYPEIAKTYYEHSLKIQLSPSAYSLYLQCLLMTPSCNEKQMYKAASRYQTLFLKKIKPYQHYDNELSNNRPLNVGHICHFFHNSVSQSLLIPYLKAHDRDKIKIFCYSDTDDNEVPDSIKNVADTWRNTKKLDDFALAEQIRRDKIDILLELNGHCVVNRYLAIAKKPAPVQISYYNIATTTGISAIDYMLVSDEMSLSSVRSFYSESIYYFKGVCGVAQFSDNFPEPSREPPCLHNKYITFGSFGGSQKVNTRVIKLWCKVLKAVPNAKFYMKAGVLSFEPFRKSYAALFEAEGINLDRIILEGFSEHHEMLKCYDRVDIALDTFPHAAGTTTMEALWQGVPVITLYGQRLPMQHGKEIISSVGHPELVAYTEQEYIDKATQLAASPERINKYKKELRNDFKNSPRADTRAFAKKLEDAYYDIWEKYCNYKR